MLKAILPATAAFVVALSMSGADAKDLKTVGVTLGPLGNPFYVALAKGTETDPVGTAYIGLAHKAGCEVMRWGWIGTRFEIMSRTANGRNGRMALPVHPEPVEGPPGMPAQVRGTGT